MRVAHVVVVTPKRCGLYETTRELVQGLRKRGVDSRMVDPAPAKNPVGFTGNEDRGCPVADMAWAVGADVIVSHSGYDGTPVEKTGQPVIHVAHGRPRSTFIGEVMGGTPVYSYHYRLNGNPRIRSVVTFWKEHVPFHKVMFPDKPVEYVQSSVDLNAWSPDGPKGYQFGGHRAEVNVVCADAFRDDIDPYNAVNAFALWARGRKGVRLHLYGTPKDLRGWAAIIRRIQDDGNMGEIKGWVDGLANVYRAADFLLTPQTINTRSVREAMACGCPVVRVRDDLQIGEIEDRRIVRLRAETMFNPDETARQFEALLA